MSARALELDPIPAEALDNLYSRAPKVAEAVEDALDWVEADPPDPRSRRRRFTNGRWAISVHAAGEEWIVIWEEPVVDQPVVRHIGEVTSL